MKRAEKKAQPTELLKKSYAISCVRAKKAHLFRFHQPFILARCVCLFLFMSVGYAIFGWHSIFLEIDVTIVQLPVLKCTNRQSCCLWLLSLLSLPLVLLISLLCVFMFVFNVHIAQSVKYSSLNCNKTDKNVWCTRALFACARSVASMHAFCHLNSNNFW